jgi:hypothetical protein
VIAKGTSNELKAQIGGYRLELEMAPDVDPHRLATVVAGWGVEQPVVDLSARRVMVA